jgi:hypothetical protein
MTPEEQMISGEKFTGEYAFSFSNQPYLEDLFNIIIHTETPITFVVGAGVSIDAGLPTWKTLIERMCNKISGDSYKKMALADSADLMRKAEFVIRMLMEEPGGRAPEEIVRAALYEKASSSVTFGPLAEAIARLGAALDERARLLTTNFDKVIEAALREYSLPADIKSIHLEEELGVQSWSEQSPVGVHNVLHVHGILFPGEVAGRSLVLTEPDFLKYGHEVRRLIAEQLRTSCVIFIGVSVTDPNLTGPLWEVRCSAGANENLLPTFVLAVPETIRLADDKRSEEERDHDEKTYALQKAKYLEQTLKMRPIFLKSYAQLVQVLWDLDLGLAAKKLPGEKQYVTSPPRPDDSLTYGNRFKQRLNACYAAIGYDEAQDTIPYEKAQELNSSLHAALFEGDVYGFLKRMTEHRNKVFGEYENFGIFLWLRVREKNHPEREAPYKLKLIGTSTYVHRAAWSTSKEILIREDSDFPAARTVFHGAQMVDDQPKRDSPFTVWQGIFAKPIRIEDFHYRTPDGKHGRDVIVVGAVTLNTTRSTQASPKSVLSMLSVNELGQLGGSLEEAMRKILRPG